MSLGSPGGERPGSRQDGQEEEWPSLQRPRQPGLGGKALCPGPSAQQPLLHTACLHPGRRRGLLCPFASGPGDGQPVVRAGQLFLLPLGRLAPCPGPPTSMGGVLHRLSPCAARTRGSDPPDAPQGSNAFLRLSSWGASRTLPGWLPCPGTCTNALSFLPGMAHRRDGKKLPSILTPADLGEGRLPITPHLRAASSCGHNRPNAQPGPRAAFCPNKDVYSFNHQIKCLTPPSPFPAQPLQLHLAGQWREKKKKGRKKKNSLIFINRESHLFPVTIFDLSK